MVDAKRGFSSTDFPYYGYRMSRDESVSPSKSGELVSGDSEEC